MNVMRGLVSLLGRLLIVPIFLLSAVGNKIPKFNAVAESMAAEGVPAPKILLGGAIAFLILGSLSIALGYRARLGAVMLLAFLGAATYYFHDFWAAACRCGSGCADEPVLANAAGVARLWPRLRRG